MNRYESLTPEDEELSTELQQALDGPVPHDSYVEENIPHNGELFDEPEILEDSELIETLQQEANSLAGVQSDSLKLYMQEISRTKLLTAAQEVELAKRIEAGEEAQKYLDNKLGEKDELQKIIDDATAAKRHMIEANLRLVVSVAKRYKGNGVAFLDLIQDGTIGLMRATEKFDWRRGFKFSTYATWWIRQSVQRSVANNGRTIRVPVHVVERVIKVSRAERKLTQELGREPTEYEISEETRLSLEKVEEAKRSVAIQPVSLNKPVDGAEDASEFGEFVTMHSSRETEDELDQLNIVEGRLLRDAVQAALEALPERESQLLKWRFGFVDDRAWSLVEIGDEMGITRERVRQIETQAIERLSGIREFQDAVAKSSDSPPQSNGDQAGGLTIPTKIEKEMSPAAEKLKSLLGCELTDSESTTLELMINGLDKKQISKKLGLSQSTIKDRASKIKNKMGVDSIEEAVEIGIEALHIDMGQN